MKSESLIAAIVEGLRAAWQDISLRTFFILIAISNFLISSSAGIIFEGPGDLTGVDDPMLGPLSDNGGSSWTHALLLDSPAIGAEGDCGVDWDQRG